ncbi:MAG: site-specific integrase, partial [Actinomycetota bacterium]|nr:site-specific integrase [Actinomycetota bacterium]
MDHLLDEFLAHLAVERGSSTHTLDAYRRDLTSYLTVLADRNVVNQDAVTREDVLAFITNLRTRGFAPSSV